MLPYKDYGYIQLKITASDGTKFIYPTKYLNFETKEGIYETLYDSFGHTHEVKIGSKKVNNILDETKLYLFGPNESLSGLPWTFFSRGFQFNLNFYELYNDWFDTWNEIKQLLHNKLNEMPWWLELDHYSASYDLKYYCSIDLFNKTKFYPFVESCMCSSNGKHLLNYIPDSLFFNYPNRQWALDRLYSGNKAFINFDYVNASDDELVIFMNDRFQKRLNFEQLILKYNDKRF